MQMQPGPAPLPSTMSPDGQFFWDGRQWVPTITPDGRWRWNGLGWDPTAVINPNDAPALAQTLMTHADETYAQAGALLAARRGEWAPDAAAAGLLAQADQLAGAVQGGNAQLATMNQQNVINRALGGSERKRIESELVQATAALRAVIIQIGRNAPATTFPDSDLLLSAARNTESQANAISEGLTAQAREESTHAARLAAAQQLLQQAEGTRSSALAAAASPVQAAQQAYDESVASARAHLGESRMPGSGDAIVAFAGVALYGNHLQTADGRGLTDGCEVFAGTARQLSEDHADLVMEAMALSSAGAATFHEAETQQSETTFLLIGATGLRSIVPVPAGQEQAAADFVVKATEAARAARTATTDRRAATKSAQSELDRVTADRAAIVAAEGEQKKVEADGKLLSPIESARTAVADAEANTAPLEAARGRLSAAIAVAASPPAPLVTGPGV